jgi:hypothetical protein
MTQGRRDSDAGRKGGEKKKKKERERETRRGKCRGM